MTDETPAADTEPPSRWRRVPAFGYADFRRYFIVRFCGNLGIHALVVAVGWQVYDIGRDPLHLGLIGLVQFLPPVLLVFVTGPIADHFDRRAIISVASTVMALVTGTLVALSLGGIDRVWPFIALMGVLGTARAFMIPSANALVANIVPPKVVPNAIAINAIAARGGAALGPLIGGVAYGLGPAVAYGSFTVVFVVSAAAILTVRRSGQIRSGRGATLTALTACFAYIRRTEILLAAITFDIFVTLMSGVTALLPVFARDILETGPEGLGLLRAAPAAGSAVIAVVLSLCPMNRNAGPLVFATIAIFGAGTIVFGLSTVVWISVAALFVMGAADMAGTYLRWSIAQLWTPDELRGRVSAVTNVSASGSSELGDFRAGLMAALIGPVSAVVFGGVLTLISVYAWKRMFPAFWRLNSLEPPRRREV